jgi:dolichol-phosphate mannosyltransferase
LELKSDPSQINPCRVGVPFNVKHCEAAAIVAPRKLTLGHLTIYAITIVLANHVFRLDQRDFVVMTRTGRVYIGLPAYNEEIALPRLLKRIELMVASSQEAITVVLYNDGSTDSTGPIARRWQGPLSLVLLDCPQNKGLGAGLRALVGHAIATADDDDVLVIMDCDDTHDPIQVSEMLRAMVEGVDVVIGSRFSRGAYVQGVPLLRRIISIGATVLFKLILPVRDVWDYTCGYRSYRVAALKKASAFYGARLIEESGFASTVELLLKLNALNIRMVETPLILRYNQKCTESSMNVRDNMKRLLWLLCRWRLRGFDRR